MTEENAHLTLDEIFELLRPVGRGQDGHSNQRFTYHLAGCAECARAIDRYRGIMAELNPFKIGGNECPAASTWAEVAAGVLPNNDALGLMEHAASCSSCSAQLREALEIVGTNAPPEPRLQQSLKTSVPARQKGLAAEMAARSRKILESESVPTTVPFVKKRKPMFLFPVWAYGAAAAVLILGIALAVFLRQGFGSTERLLGQAYAQQRTVELRIPGAGYGPVRVERGQKQSQMSSPGALLEAEAAIKKGMEQHPEDPNLLRQKAEADLLNWDFQPAIETLGHALRVQPQSSKLLVDLATAHFERAEATDTPADYESALQYLGDALRLSPKDPAALFNRAIVHERLFLYNRAIADWEELLTVEADSGWKQEAQKRLNEIRTKQQRHSARDAPDHLTLAEFKSAVENKTTSDPEQYIQLAERKILPDISNPSQRDPSYQLAMLLAKHFESAHSDRFFADLMQSAGKTGFHEAVLNLGEASKANNAGHSEEAYSSATRSGELFQKLHSDAGEAASEFEEAYALHFESHAAQCAKTAAKVAETAKQRGYTWLEIQALLEQAICLNMKRDLGRAEDLALKAIALSKDHGYLGFRLRGLVLLASLEADAGNESSAWQAIREGLEQYWTGNLPPMRAYSFYMLLDSIAENLGHWNVQSAAAFEALQFIAGGPDHIIEAEERSRLAGAALHLGMPELAEEQFAEAARLFSSAPDTSSVQWRVLEARIDLASVQSLKHDHTNRAFEELLGFLPEVQRISNRYVESQYYTTLGHLKLNTGDPQTATKYLLQAINLADIGLDSLSSWQGRLKWMEQNRSPYILMTELLFRTGQQQAALDLWEHFRTASSKGFDVNSSNTRLAVISDPAKSTVHTPKVFDAKILTYAFAPDGLMLWLQDQHKLRAVFVPISLSEFKRTAATLIEECSRPDSDLSNLRQNAHRLHEWLIQPVSAWLPSSGNLIIKPDGLVGSLPVEALLDSSGAYLGERYSIIVVPALTLSNQPARAATIRASDRALIVSAPSNAKQGLEPPPGAVSEANEVGRQFTRSTVLAGGTAKVDAVRREITKNEIFHFAGHAAFGRAGAVMLLADGSLDVAGIDPKPSDGDHRTIQEPLSSMKLAVFSACGTARPNETSQWNSVVTEFLEAGTREVVASHWNVDSVTTREFMASFYRFLMSGSTVSGALQTAAAELRAKPETIHPYYWAAFSSFSAT